MKLSRLPSRARAQVAAVADGGVRVAPLFGVPQLLKDLGQDPDAVIRGSGVDPRLFDDPENFIDFDAAGRLLARCSLTTGCPHFGLLLGQRVGMDALGLVGMLVEHSPDVGTALRNLVLHLLLHDRGAAPTLEIAEQQVLLGYVIYQPGVEGAPQIYDLAMAIGRNIMKSLCGDDWRATEVLLPHGEPADTRPFKRYFSAPVRFDSERAALLFPAAALERPVRGADPLLYKRLEERIRDLEEPGDDDIVAQVRRVLRNLLLSGGASVDQVAQIFSCHRRTLNRRLRKRGPTFRELVEEGRYDLARQLLRDTDLAVIEVAEVLGYGDTAAFTRAFRRWSGASPSTWRADQRPG